MYGIKEGYVENLKAYQREQTESGASVHQIETYRKAASLIKIHRLQSVLDIGCGMPLKLEKYISPLCKDITGIDLKPTIRKIKNIRKKTGKYAFGKWIICNVEYNVPELSKVPDLIIIADVIEHLRNPDNLLTFLVHKCKGAYVILSTPDRDTLNNPNGPPRNKKHVREWTLSEFVKYINSRGLCIEDCYPADDPQGYEDIICVCKVK